MGLPFILVHVCSPTPRGYPLAQLVNALDLLYYYDTGHPIGPGSNPDRGMKCRREKYQL